MIQIIRKLIASNKGATAVEYGLIVSIIVIGMIGAFSAVATKTNAMWANVANEVGNNQ